MKINSYDNYKIIYTRYMYIHTAICIDYLQFLFSLIIHFSLLDWIFLLIYISQYTNNLGKCWKQQKYNITFDTEWIN